MAHKNEDKIKEMIVDGHNRGVCDSSGRTVKTSDGRPVAKPKPGLSSSVAKTYVYRDGELVLKG